MNEKLSSRISRLIAGSLNNFVDTLEKIAPERVVEEAIREVKSAVNEVRGELGRVIAKKHLTQTCMAKEEQQHKSLNEKIAIALNNQREDLAEAAIAKQLELEGNKLVFESTLENCIQQEQELQAYLLGLDKKKQDMEIELAQLLMYQQGQENSKYQQRFVVENCIENAESVFNRLLETRTGLGYSSLLTARSATIQLAQLEKLSKQEMIQKRLKQFNDLKE